MALRMSAETSPAERPNTLALMATSRIRSRRLIWLEPVVSVTRATWPKRTMRGLPSAEGVTMKRQALQVLRSCCGPRVRGAHSRRRSGRPEPASCPPIGPATKVRKGPASLSCAQTQVRGRESRNTSTPIKVGLLGFDTRIQIHQTGYVADFFHDAQQRQALQLALVWALQ